MKAQVTVSVGDYDTTRHCHQFYELPGLGSMTDTRKQNGTTHHEVKESFDVEGNEVGVDHSPELSLHAVCDDNDDRHCVRLVNIPVSSTKPVDFFSSEYRVSGFTERVYVSAPQQGPQRSFTSFCHFESGEPRCKQVVDLRLKMVPVDYCDTLILLRDCTRRRFRTGMECWPRNRPVRFQETCYVTPKRLESTYVSYCDYGVNKSHTRYQSALQVTPRSYCNNFVRGFEFNSEDEEEEYSSEMETSSVDADGDESLGFDDVLNYNVAVRPLAVLNAGSDNTSEKNNLGKDIPQRDTNEKMGQARESSSMIVGGREIVSNRMADADFNDGKVRLERRSDGITMDGRKSLGDERKEMNVQKNIKKFETLEKKNTNGDNSKGNKRISSGDLLDFSNDEDDVFSVNGGVYTNTKR